MIYDDLVAERGVDPVWDAELVRATRAVLADSARRSQERWRRDLWLWGMPALLSPIIPRGVVIVANIT